MTAETTTTNEPVHVDLARRAAALAVRAEQVEGTDPAEWIALNHEAENARRELQDGIRAHLAGRYLEMPASRLDDLTALVTGRAMAAAYTSVRAGGAS